ncbi:MAG: alpha/beta fold hydrolase [Alphaproteobacteria bacterium]|nr:alpha/beta fold hydrolase [Alphaproteobacteria bacterium]
MRARPDRRLAPRPLPVHLAMTALLWSSSRVALPSLSAAWPASSGPATALRRLADAIAAAGTKRVAAALDSELTERARAFLAGLEAYRSHPFRRRSARAPVLWRAGTTRLLDYGSPEKAEGAPVLIIPSLINRFDVLDLLPERSFLRHLAGQGLRPMVVDWGAPGRIEGGFALADYVARLEAALAEAARHAGGPVGVIGYCMGGLLALVLGLRHPRRVACLALLGTPWDFHAERGAQAALLGSVAAPLAALCGNRRPVPVAALQALFLSVDPFLAERKFRRFAALDPAGPEARAFVALEDWVNDGVPLALAVAQECARSWYGDNAPARGTWRCGRTRVQPQRLRQPALVVVPSRDRLVPPCSAEPLAAAIPGAEAMRPPLGHIGMMAASAAPETLWNPIAAWLRARLDSPRRRLLTFDESAHIGDHP